MNDSHSDLLRRLRVFSNNCLKGILTPEVRKRRQIALYKAVWALSCLSTPGQPGFRIPMRWDNELEVRLYHHSAFSMQQWANLNAAHDLLDETLRHLMACKRATAAKQNPNTTRVSENVLRLHSEYDLLHFDQFKPFPKLIEPSHIEAWVEEIRTLPLQVYLKYLECVVESESKPYHFHSTLSLLTPKLTILPSEESIQTVENALNSLVQTHSDLLETQEDLHWLDEIFGAILSHFQPPSLYRMIGELAGSQYRVPVSLPWGLTQYLNTRKCRQAVYMVVSQLSTRGWKCVVGTLSPSNNWTTVPIDYHLTALWTLFSVKPSSAVRENLSVLEEVLPSISRTSVPSITPSVLAMAKQFFLLALAYTNQRGGDGISLAAQNLLFGDTPSPPDTTFEASLQILTDFIDCCCSIDLPYKAAETLGYMGSFFSSKPFQPVRQIQFAAAVMKLCEAAVDCTAHATLVEKVLRHHWFQESLGFGLAGTGLAGTACLPTWLTDPAARDTLTAAFTIYLTRISPSGDDSKLIEHVTELVTLLNTSQSEQEDQAPEIMRTLADTEPDLVQGPRELTPNRSYYRVSTWS
ncbi:hypothetical protein DFH06DRAFT_1196469 [Mycena polygramma]|nr:hypothetical protein DFH06DRAFT_1196469 [Mycena polygramma]